MTLTSPNPTVASTVPAGRGRWRVIAYQRQFSNALPVIVTELPDARSRRLDTKWNTSAQFTFTIDGHRPAAKLLTELATDIYVMRWDDSKSQDVCMFRGLLDHSEDQISEQSATVTFTAHDYFAILGRRMFTSNTGNNTGDQDSLVQWLLSAASNAQASNGTTFNPGSYLPLVVQRKNPDGSNRSAPGPTRTRAYPAATIIGTAIDQMAYVQQGFDYAVQSIGPSWPYDYLNIYYPQQGVARTDVALVFGANVSSLTRTVSSADYSNYIRVIGNKASADPNAPQFFSEQWNTDSNNVTVNPVGLWMNAENASDVTIQATLDDKANGDLAIQGLLTPSYTLGLRAGVFYPGLFNMGDAVPLYINEGRLAVNTSVRVVGIAYAIGDDGQEDVTLTVGRPPQTLARILYGGARDIDALARR